MNWAEDQRRLDWHSNMDQLFLTLKDDDDYVPPASVITNASKFGPIEITLNTPFRAGT